MKDFPNIVVKTMNCTKIYPNNIKGVDNVSLEIRRGEILGLLGPNGAGKTTLVRLVSAFFPPTSGDVHVLGKESKNAKIWIRKNVGVVQQEFSYEPYISTTKNLMIYGQLLGLTGEKLAARAEEVMEIFRLPKHEEAAELSAGNKKRLQVAREFLKIRPIMILDEPTAGLDPIGRNQVMSQIRELKKEEVTIIYVTHILGEAELLCDRIVLMDKGKILHLAQPRELKNKVSTLKEIRVVLKKKIPEEIVGKLPVDYANLKENILICRGHNNLGEIHALCDLLREYGDTIEVKDLSLDDVFVELIGG